jgi:hypothetical protein
MILIVGDSFEEVMEHNYPPQALAQDLHEDTGLYMAKRMA